MSHPHHQPDNNIIVNNYNHNDNYINNDINLMNEWNNVYNDIVPIAVPNQIPAADNSNKPKKKISKRVCKKSASAGMMPAFSEYDAFMKSEHKVSELKDMCKHYGIKCSGTKQELKLRVHTHLIQSHHVKRIQRMIRGKFIKMHDRMSGPAYKDRSLCVNDTDFYSMERMSDIQRNQFISFKDDAGMVYGFDVMSLHTYYDAEMNNGHQVPLNPYNRAPFPLTLRSQMHRKIGLTDILGIPCKIEEEPEPVLSQQQRDEQLLFIVFQQINSHGHYADSAWFSELNVVGIMRFMRELADIWNYRAQIMPQLKQEICPPNGDPFRYVDLRYIQPDMIKHQGIQIINTFVTSGTNRDSQSLGAYYVLSALTLVSQPAQAAMPWLYESVVYVP
jgi:hypothetical protein